MLHVTGVLGEGFQRKSGVGEIKHLFAPSPVFIIKFLELSSVYIRELLHKW